jgi:alpha-tubulin suppressor-like RCC1 family protein
MFPLHCVLVNIDGEVFVSGYNQDQQLGLPNERLLHTFTLVPIPVKILVVYCGSSFNIALSEANEMWGWGRYATKPVFAIPHEHSIISPDSIYW